MYGERSHGLVELEHSERNIPARKENSGWLSQVLGFVFGLLCITFETPA